MPCLAAKRVQRYRRIPRQQPNRQPPTTSASLLQSASARASAATRVGLQYSTSPSTSPLRNNPITTTPVRSSTNPTSFRSLPSSHRAVVAMFKSATCAPCRMIEPVLRSSRGQRACPRTGLSGSNWRLGWVLWSPEQGVAATPTFGFFLDGKTVRACCSVSHLFAEEWVCVQTHELKGVNAPELRTQVDLFLYQAFPRMLILDD